MWYATNDLQVVLKSISKRKGRPLKSVISTVVYQDSENHGPMISLKPIYSVDFSQSIHYLIILIFLKRKKKVNWLSTNDGDLAKSSGQKEVYSCL